MNGRIGVVEIRVRVEPETAALLAQEAKEMGIPVAELVRWCLDEHYEHLMTNVVYTPTVKALAYLEELQRGVRAGKEAEVCNAV